MRNPRFKAQLGGHVPDQGEVEAGARPEFPNSGGTDEELIHAYLRRMGTLARLAPEEESFHCRAFFDQRAELGARLSHLPRLVARQLGLLKTTEIVHLDEHGQADRSLVDEKRELVVGLADTLAAAAADLERVATRHSAEADHARGLLHRSLERLLSRYVCGFRFYTACLEAVEELSRPPADASKKALAARLLMPAAAFAACRDGIREAFRHMDDARTVLLEANLRLVMSVVRRYMNYGIGFQDLFQEGYLGLSVAVDRFEPQRGHRFSTYAVWWIRQTITQALSAQSRTIRIPANMARALHRINRAEQVLLQELGREPTAEEIAKLVELPVERIRAWRKMEHQPISLESPIGDTEGAIVSDLVVDQHTATPDEVASTKLLRETISLVLDTLTEREREIITHRFGLLNRPLLTLEELSSRFGVTHERIRQIEAAAIEKLRDPSRRQYFDGYG